MRVHNIFQLITAFILFTCVFAAASKPIVVAPEYEERYHDLLNELRCLVCQNQTIAESNAELAVDLRHEVKKMLEQGSTNEDIINFMANRYGDFVLYKPLIKPKTYLLWFGPFLALLLVLLILFYIISKQRKISTTNLTQEETDQLSSILKKTED